MQCGAILINAYSLTGNVLGPADDDHQLAICQVTKGGERALGRVRLQRVRHGEQLLRLRHQEVGHDDGGGTWSGKDRKQQFTNKSPTWKNRLKVPLRPAQPQTSRAAAYLMVSTLARMWYLKWRNC